ncbi:MAG TPA: hypothetical protein VJV39_23010 [Dongiaceae bacterium]|nr:hypothetical protein [Dongiaceae bacterium]
MRSAVILGAAFAVFTSASAIAENAEERLAFDTERLADYTYGLAFWTFGLVLVATIQAIFFFWQLRVMQTTLADSKKIAEATVRSANATTETVESFRVKERARLLAGDATIKIHAKKLDDGRVQRILDITIRLLNYGGTPARVGKGRLRIVVDQVNLQENLPLRGVEGVAATQGYYQIPVLPNEWGADQANSWEIVQTNDEWERMFAAHQDSPKIFAVGSVTFRDVFDQIRTFVYALKYTGGRFVPTRGTTYNREYDGLYEPEDDGVD